jgi:hypothetical protein
MFVSGKPFQPNVMLASNVMLSLKGRLMVLSASIRLGWKGITLNVIFSFKRLTPGLVSLQIFFYRQ